MVVLENVRRRLLALASAQTYSTIVTYEEQTRGWLAYLGRAKTVSDLVQAYRRLEQHLKNFQQIPLLSFTEAAAVEFQRLRKLKVRIGTMDLRIAAIALTNQATVLTRNARDFLKVPGLRIEDWST